MTRNRWMSMADPIHGMIRFDRQDDTQRLILQVMNSQAFQRLRRIKQMGLAEFVFPGATHNRFIHSLGATHLMMQALAHLEQTPSTRQLLDAPFDGTPFAVRNLLLLGILLHDIGHGPLSHTLEDVLNLKERQLLHDDYWRGKILREDPELQALWATYGDGLPEAIIRFMDDGDAKFFLAQLISSQLDMDRLDYLQRDSHFLGVQYGRIEAQRIIANLEVAHLPEGKPVIAIREEAVPAIEHYLFGRHQAYKMALHSLDKASEALLKKTLERFRWVREQGLDPGHPAEELFQLMVDGRTLTTEQYLRMDDCYLWEAIRHWSRNAEDALLRELANRLLGHGIFKFVDLGQYGVLQPLESIAPVYEALQAYYHQRGLSFEFGFCETLVKPKPLYQTADVKEPIWVRTGQGVADLKDVSSLPLSVENPKGQKHLAFVWDSEAKRFLEQRLQAHLHP